MTWLSIHLFYSELENKFLTEALEPFIQKMILNGYFTEYFFIRYWEGGPHIRLRLKIKESDTSTIKEIVNSYFMNYFQLNPSEREELYWANLLPENCKLFPNNSIQYIEYIPELKRYGGSKGVKLAEKHFKISSMTVLEILKNHSNWSYEQALSYSIQLQTTFCLSLNMLISDMREFFSSFFRNSFPSKKTEKNVNTNITQYRYFEITTENKDIILKAFENSFLVQKDYLIMMLSHLIDKSQTNIHFEEEWLNKWLCECKRISLDYESYFSYSKQINLLSDENIQALKKQILGSLMHMTNNRLGIVNRDEVFIAYLIKRTLESNHFNQ